MAKYGLTADELLLVYLSFIGQDEENHIEYFNKWYNGGGASRLRNLFNSLKDKGVIIKNYNPETYNPNEIEFNKNFVKGWLKNSGYMGQELLSAYPPFMNINGTYMPLKDISKRFANMEEFFFFYGKEIGFSPEKHAEVMEILEWAKENHHLNFGILNFVISHQWTALKELRDNPELAPISTNSIYTDD